MVVYHGTDVKFNQFDLTKVGEGSDLLGKGIYLTENKKVAEFYANLVAKKRYIKKYEEGILGSENPIYEDDASKKAKKHEIIYDFFINAKNIVDINELGVDTIKLFLNGPFLAKWTFFMYLSLFRCSCTAATPHLKIQQTRTAKFSIQWQLFTVIHLQSKY